MGAEATMILTTRSVVLNLWPAKNRGFRAPGQNDATPPDLSAIMFAPIVFLRLRAVMP
jgi:hypothetical protein